MITDSDQLLLLFFSSPRSGPSRRMESLLAHLARKERGRLKVVQIDVDARRRLADRLGIESAPSLVLAQGNRVLARHEGRASAPQIEAMLEPHLAVLAA